MAAQSLQTVISINATVGNGFSQVGATLTELGNMVNGVSQQLINFGKESVTVYRNYEKSMKGAEVALSTTYGRGTKELSTVMGQLDAAATEWAASTIFHTNDVGNAISEAAHAGWNLEQIMNGLPAAMQLAQAGGMDLSQAVNYIVKSTNAAGIGFEDLGTFIDLWAFAANSSASTIDEFGQAMLRMGSTMQFISDPEELMTLIAVTANAGAVGSEAGTLIRNSMIRLIAPTDKAEKAMAQLGATSLETAGLLEDEALQAANARLAAQGFSVYDQNGQLRSTLDIYRDMYVALGGIAGGFEEMDKNQNVIGILSSIFPTRTITEALTLLRGAAEGYDGLYDAMKGGDAKGYGQYAAETMMDTLDGKIETFESKVERLKQLVGQELSGQVEAAAGFIGDIVDGLAEMDSDSFGALVSGLEVIATAGPALMLAGGAFRLIGYALTPAGGIGLGLIALTAAATAIKELQEADFANNFGKMELDTTQIQSYVQGLGADFKTAAANVDEFKTAMNNSVTAYQTASTTFSSELLTNMLTNAKLSDKDKEQLESLGQEMYLAVQGAIANSTAASMTYWQQLFGGDGKAEYDPTYREIIELTNQAYEDAMAEAEMIGNGLRDALTKAFADGQIDGDEYQNILSYMRSYNDAIAKAAAEAQSEEDYIKQAKWLRKAQTASLGEVDAITKEAQKERDSILAQQEDAYLTERFRLEYRGADEATLAAADARYEQQRMQTQASYDQFLATLWESQIRQSDQGNNFDTLAEFAGLYLAGGINGDIANEMLRAMMGNSAYAGDRTLAIGHQDTDRANLGRMMTMMIASMGGTKGMEERIAYYERTGNAEMATRMKQIYAMEQLINNFDDGNYSNDTRSAYGTSKAQSMNKRSFDAAVGMESAQMTTDVAKWMMNLIGGDNSHVYQAFSKIGDAYASGNAEAAVNAFWGLDGLSGKQFNGIVEGLAATYDFNKLLAGDSSVLAGSVASNQYAAWKLLFGGVNPDDFLIQPKIDTQAMSETPIPVPIQPYTDGDDAAQSLKDQGVEVQVSGDTTELQATIDGEDGQTLLEYISGDAGELAMTIKDQDGRILIERVTGNAAALAAIIESYNGKTVTVNIRGNKMFAEGGRATEASTFGEAGPEWAIPEAHTQRTAELLNAARAASGFTWPELIARFGGLNADAGHMPSTIVYSPTINAQDATGVEKVLRDDKERLEKWFKEKQMRDEAVVYQ